jgi:hypothetical protein
MSGRLANSQSLTILQANFAAPGIDMRVEILYNQ